MRTFYVNVWKPSFARVLAIIALIVSIPIAVVIALLLYLGNSGNVIFVQNRVGKHGRIFSLYKFKTLRDTVDGSGTPLPDLERQFPLGRLLRHYHLDELPQLLNIILGNMNFIGPRPLLPEYLAYYTVKQSTRHDVKPGIMGLSQIKGGNLLAWGHRLMYDAFYADHCNIGLDFFILWHSMKYIINKKRVINSYLLYSESFIDYCKRQANQEP